jgi:hypothetical protein
VEEPREKHQMKVRFVKPTAWAAVVVAFVCSQAAADLTPLTFLDAEAHAARAAATANVGVMESVARRARVILQTARYTGQARDVACANEGLSRVDMALRVGRDYAHRVLEAWDHGDVVAARSELSRLSTTTAAARAAGAQAEFCIDAPRPSEGTTVRLIID